MRKIMLTFNSLKISLPSDIRNLFTYCWVVSNTNTRYPQTDLRLPPVNTEFAKTKLSCSGASLFNSLQNDLKDIEIHTTPLFKIKLKKFFLQLNHQVNHINKFSCNSCKHVVMCHCYTY